LTNATFGEKHHKAKLTDREVELARQLFDAGWSLVVLAEKFDTSRGHMHDLTSYRRRALVRVTDRG